MWVISYRLKSETRVFFFGCSKKMDLSLLPDPQIIKYWILRVDLTRLRVESTRITVQLKCHTVSRLSTHTC
jgi:hypothetical protein